MRIGGAELRKTFLVYQHLKQRKHSSLLVHGALVIKEQRKTKKRSYDVRRCQRTEPLFEPLEPILPNDEAQLRRS